MMWQFVVSLVIMYREPGALHWSAIRQPWSILNSIVTGMVFAFTGKRFHCDWFPIILHSEQSVFTLFLILGLILGLA